MFSVLRKISAFAGSRRGLLKKSMLVAFLGAVFTAFQFWALMLTLEILVAGASLSIWPVIGVMMVSVAGRTACSYWSTNAETETGYFMVAEKRIHIGDRLRYIPMGYFNDNSLGNITAVVTTTLGDVENNAARCLVSVIGGVLNTLAMSLAILLVDWRLGLLAIGGILAYLLVAELSQRSLFKTGPARQRAQMKLVEAVLEYVQGMSVVKSFNLTGRGDRTLQEALEYNCRSNLNIEKMFTPYIMAQGIALQLGSVAMMLAAVWFYLSGTMILANALMVVIMSFLVFAQISSAGSGMSLLRIVSSCMAHADETDAMPQLAETGQAGTPRDHGITFDHVSFSYDQRPILRDVSFAIPDRTTTAIVGPSGSGKTTLCNLIARFWDVESGAVLVGGQNVKDYTLEGLMDQISMVFQRVYLFQDTVYNNIAMGRTDATREEVYEAARKARCYDFIMELPDGFDTVIGEGGASLSGGERQRISIARCILKDAPIVILDEATASVDADNESYIQEAITQLCRGKTLLVIAHRLNTIRHADEILVIDQGRIVQAGDHDKLMAEEGIYRRFITARSNPTGWCR